MVEAELAGSRSAIVSPESPIDVPDRDYSSLLGYLPLEFSGKPRNEQETIARDLLAKCSGGGDQDVSERTRGYHPSRRSGRDPAAIGPLPDGDGEREGQGEEAEPHQRASRQLLPGAQSGEQRRRSRPCSSCTPRLAAPPGAEALAWKKSPRAAGPLQTTLDDKKQAMIHQRITELITSVQPRVFNSLAPTKIIELFRLGEGHPPTLGIGTAEIVNTSYSFLGFCRLMLRAVVRKSIARGIEEGHFGYFSGPKPGLSSEGKYEVAPNRVQFKTPWRRMRSISTPTFGVTAGHPAINLTDRRRTHSGRDPEAERLAPVKECLGSHSASWRDWSRAGNRNAETRTRENGPTHIHRGSKYALRGLERDCQPCRPRWRSHGNCKRPESESGFDKSKLQNGVLETAT